MWFVLLVFAVSLAIGQAPPPVPRQTTNTGTSASQDGRSNASSKKTPAAPVPAPTSGINPTASPSQSTTDAAKGENHPDSISISKLPSVSVERDWIDYVTLCFTAGLLLVGWFGVRAAIRTLKAIQAQGEHMKRQADTMDQQRTDSNQSSIDALAALNRQIAALERHVEAARENAVAAKHNADTLISSERAWVIVRPFQSVLIPIGPGAIQPYNTFRFTITNKGRTVARLMKFQSGGFFAKQGTELADTPHYEPHQESGPGGSVQTVEIQHGTVFAPGEPADKGIGINTFLDRENIEHMSAGRWVFYVFGRIEYFDFANTGRAVQFCYQYKPDRDVDGNPIYWTKAGPLAYNTHD